ncbi:NAD(P)/FAD-dependent oxidoreductase [Heyndrickxia acidiproducens]|uniref:NAD(P)/FAD-dependent oxidoreductase n=1 Tax=Heyndrickxia acidiproducens TaxID=1121084 RepID=UPI0003642AC7|nr:FAD-dependent oxidoreductase [Heyndrickxia acidiproducens]
MDCDVCIIGGGPSGLAAAWQAGKTGLSVIIVDENQMLGGQLNQQRQLIQNLPGIFTNQQLTGFELADELVHLIEPYDVKPLTGFSFIGVEADGTIGVNNGRETRKIRAKSIIVATGAAEEPILFPGWTLPGSFSIGAMQILINREKIVPGRTAVMIGSGSRTCQVASEMQQAGITVAGVIEERDKFDYSPSDLQRLKELNIPLFAGVSQIRAEGEEEVESIHFKAGDGKEQSINTELVCIDGGLSPIVESNFILGYQLQFNPDLGNWIPSYDSCFHTSAPNVFVAGNAAGITSHGAILITGLIAGLSAAEALGKYPDKEAVSKQRKKWWNELKTVEMAYDSTVYQARMQHVRQFEQVKIKQMS